MSPIKSDKPAYFIVRNGLFMSKVNPSIIKRQHKIHKKTTIVLLRPCTNYNVLGIIAEFICKIEILSVCQKCPATVQRGKPLLSLACSRCFHLSIWQDYSANFTKKTMLSSTGINIDMLLKQLDPHQTSTYQYQPNKLVFSAGL